MRGLFLYLLANKLTLCILFAVKLFPSQNKIVTYFYGEYLCSSILKFQEATPFVPYCDLLPLLNDKITLHVVTMHDLFSFFKFFTISNNK